MRKYVRATVVALVLLGGGTAVADPVDDLVLASDHAARQVLATVDAAQPHVSPPGPSSWGIPRKIELNTDYVVITDRGSGPIFSYHGAFHPSKGLWDCQPYTGPSGAVGVECDPINSDYEWKCDAMVVNAKALPTYEGIREWADTAVANVARQQPVGMVAAVVDGRGQLPAPPSTGKFRWGQVAGYVTCNEQLFLETETATQAQPLRTASGFLSRAPLYRCEARHAKGDPSAPVTAYTVNCNDPGAPGVS